MPSPPRSTVPSGNRGVGAASAAAALRCALAGFAMPTMVANEAA
jgi:hypothetical protein